MNTDPKVLVATIERMMAALSEDDRAGVEELVSEDFHAFESGVSFGGRELLDLMSRNYSRGKRYRWSVTSPQVEVHGDLAAVVYVNIGSIVETFGAESVPQSWLETVLLRRGRSGWRIAFIHSTRVQRATDET